VPQPFHARKITQNQSNSIKIPFKTIPVLLSKSFSQPIMLFSEKQLNLQEQRLCAIFAIEMISVKNITN
jgi:hypothetical protein